jgi:hypothetical protein
MPLNQRVPDTSLGVPPSFQSLSSSRDSHSDNRSAAILTNQLTSESMIIHRRRRFTSAEAAHRLTCVTINPGKRPQHQRA